MWVPLMNSPIHYDESPDTLSIQTPDDAMMETNTFTQARFPLQAVLEQILIQIKHQHTRTDKNFCGQKFIAPTCAH